MDTSLIGIGMALGISIILLYTRKQKWVNPTVVWFVLSGLFILGLYGLFIENPGSRNDRLLYYNLLVPLIYWACDRFFKRLSLKHQKRDFILFLQYSTEIDSSIGGKNPHVTYYDKQFSFGLLFIIVFLVIAGVGLIK